MRKGNIDPKVKPLEAYAIVDSGNKIDCFDYRVPIYWLRKMAAQDRNKRSFSDSKIVKVIIQESR